MTTPTFLLLKSSLEFVEVFFWGDVGLAIKFVLRSKSLNESLFILVICAAFWIFFTFWFLFVDFTIIFSFELFFSSSDPIFRCCQFCPLQRSLQTLFWRFTRIGFDSFIFIRWRVFVTIFYYLVRFWLAFRGNMSNCFGLMLLHGFDTLVMNILGILLLFEVWHYFGSIARLSVHGYDFNHQYSIIIKLKSA